VVGFVFQAEDGIRDWSVTGVQTCALPICKKIQVIKEVRAITALGLTDAKALVEGAPKAIKEGVDKAEAEEIKGKIEAAGGTVELK